MDLTQIPWYIPRLSQLGQDLSRKFMELGFEIVGIFGYFFRVIPPDNWTGKVVKKSSGYLEAEIVDADNKARVRCIVDEEDDEDSPDPVDIVYSTIL